jgi:hypothetical protein
VKIGAAERPFLAAEARALAEQVGDGERRASYEEVARMAEAGEVPDERAATVEAVVALALETGRAHAVHGPAGVRALVSVWKETPRGEQVSQELEELNEALTALRGLPVQSVRVSPTGPGTYSVGISAGDYEMRLSVDRTAVRLRSLNVGGGGIGE